MKYAFFLAAASAVALAAPSTAADRGVTIPGKLFEPERLQTLVGDTVTWTNQDSVTHTVTADDGAFDSGDIAPDGSFSLTFTHTGTYRYHCAIHRFMTGEVDVYALAFSGPDDAIRSGGEFTLRGLARQGTKSVDVERRTDGGAFAWVATVSVAADGSFELKLRADVSADYRAVSGREASPPVRVSVSPRLALHARRRGRRDVLVGTAVPGQPHMQAVIQYYSRERFAWYPFARVRLNAHSRLSYLVPPGLRAHLRLVLLQATPGFVGGTSNAVAVGLRRR